MCPTKLSIIFLLAVSVGFFARVVQRAWDIQQQQVAAFNSAPERNEKEVSELHGLAAKLERLPFREN